MQKTLLIISILSFTACKKKEVIKIVEVEKIVNTTTTKHCFTKENIGYDSLGVEEFRSIYYYTGNNLDSIVSFQSGKHTYTFTYTYSSPNTRKAETYLYGVLQNGYNIQTLDADYNVVRSEYYSNGKKMTSTTFNFTCQ